MPVFASFRAASAVVQMKVVCCMITTCNWHMSASRATVGVGRRLRTHRWLQEHAGRGGWSFLHLQLTRQTETSLLALSSLRPGIGLSQLEDPTLPSVSIRSHKLPQRIRSETARGLRRLDLVLRGGTQGGGFSSNQRTLSSVFTDAKDRRLFFIVLHGRPGCRSTVAAILLGKEREHASRARTVPLQLELGLGAKFPIGAEPISDRRDGFRTGQKLVRIDEQDGFNAFMILCSTTWPAICRLQLSRFLSQCVEQVEVKITAPLSNVVCTCLEAAVLKSEPQITAWPD